MSRDRRTDQPADSRNARLGAALRENLARRKAQARERAAGPADDEASETDKPQDGHQTRNPATSED